MYSYKESITRHTKIMELARFYNGEKVGAELRDDFLTQLRKLDRTVDYELRGKKWSAGETYDRTRKVYNVPQGRFNRENDNQLRRVNNCSEEIEEYNEDNSCGGVCVCVGGGPELSALTMGVLIRRKLIMRNKSPQLN